MGCCGEASSGRLTITQRDIDDGVALRIEYDGLRALTVVGPATGKRYAFSAVKRVGSIDPRDAAALLRDKHFRLKGIVREEK